MKKTVLTAMAIAAAAYGVHAQGSLSGIQTVFSSDGVTAGLNQETSATVGFTSNYFTGSVDLEILYSATATAGTVTALNALDGTAAGGTALTVAENTDGFSVVSTEPSVTSLTPGFFGGGPTAISGGDLTAAAPTKVGLVGVPTGGSGVLALYGIVVGGADNGWAGLIAWTQSSMGGDPNATPVAGTPSPIQQDPSGMNLDVVPTPEPTTLAFAGLGGLSMLLLRRRNK
jgi:hypothetical protein